MRIRPSPDDLMNAIRKIFSAGFSIVTLLFALCGFTLIFFAGSEWWNAIRPEGEAPARARFNSILESIALLTIAVASLHLGQTILEEEVRRESEMSAPTRLRRFLSRFMTVIIVALSIEFLVAVFHFIHGDPSRLPHAAAIGVGTAALFAALALFIRFNKDVEKMEPEAMEKVKREDKTLET
ncbi:MAG TPA: hypothetical protein VFQ92_16575 [Blastocatellia bacterium]|nr:hypothetical protein [Blastocatellia bacterium]